MTVGIEMRRTVVIGEFFCAEGMGNEIIDAANEEMIRLIFFQTDALFPIIVAKDLAHRPILLFRFNRGGTLCELGKRVLVKFAVSVIRRIKISPVVVLTLRQNLTADVVNTRHVLSPKSAEIMTERGTRAAMLTAVLDQMTDVCNAMRFTPAAELTGEIPANQLCQAIHVKHAHARCVLAVLPEICQKRTPVFAELFTHDAFHGRTPRKILLRAENIAMGIGRTVAQFRFIGEKSGDRFAEIIGIMRPMRFVYSIDEDLNAVLLKQADMVAAAARVA